MCPDYGGNSMRVGTFEALDNSKLTHPGADLDMINCHPGDLDPHAVSGTLKSYLRECRYCRPYSLTR